MVPWLEGDTLPVADGQRTDGRMAADGSHGRRVNAECSLILMTSPTCSFAVSEAMSEQGIYTVSQDKTMKRWKPKMSSPGKYELEAELQAWGGNIFREQSSRTQVCRAHEVLSR